MRIGVRRIGLRPGVRGRAFVELPLSAAAASVPTSLVRRPVAHARRTVRCAAGQRALAHARGLCAGATGGVVKVIVAVLDDVAGLVGAE